MSRITFTRAATAVGALSLSVVLAACSGGATASDPTSSDSGSAGNLEVFSWWTSGSESDALNALFDAYRAEHPGVEVVNGAVSGGGGGNAQAVLQTRLQGGNPPDIWQTHPGTALAQYTDAGLVADVSSIYTDNGLADVIPPAMLEGVTHDGKQYGVDSGAHRGNVLFFSTAALEAGGVATPGEGYDFTQFMTDLETLDAAGVTPLCIGAKDAFATTELFENTLLGVVGADGWRDLTTGNAAWDSDAVKEAAANFSAMLEYADPDATALTWDQATKKLAAGECAFESMGDWAYGELAKDAELDAFGAVAHPGTEGSFITVVDTLVAPAEATNAQEAIDFLTVVSTAEAQLAFSKAKGSVPIRTDVDVTSLSEYQQGVAEAFKSDELLGSIVHGHAMSPQFNQSMTDAVTTFAQSGDVESFTQALANAAQA